MTYFVQYSGGIGSWAAARRLVDAHGPDAVRLVFADTLIEDEDLYRFLDDSVAELGVRLDRIADGRTPWEVFHDVRYLGNSRLDPCSRILKRDLLRSWLDEHADPAVDVIAIGIDWTEIHRFERAAPRWEPFELVAPMCDRPYLDRCDVLELVAEHGLEPPRLYALGFPHNNCGGFCVKAGFAAFELLLREMPERYREHELAEEELRAYLGKPIAIMRSRAGETVTPVTMREFRGRVEAGERFDRTDFGGCGCAVDP